MRWSLLLYHTAQLEVVQEQSYKYRVATNCCNLNSMATSLLTATTALTDSLEQVY